MATTIPARTPIWVLLAGLPGTGKSTLAQALAARLNATILDKDRVRAALFPNALIDYSDEQDQLCMRAMLAAAAYLTERLRVDYILFDGRTFSRQLQVEEVLQAALQAGAHWRILQLVCADEVVEQRLACNDPAHPAQNRSLDLYRTLQHQAEPILRANLPVETTRGIEGQLGAIEAYLREGAS